MRKSCVALGFVLWLGAASFSSVAAEGQPPAEGAALPAPKEAAHQAYLGLTGKKEFTISDIPAEVVIIEIMNMY